MDCSNNHHNHKLGTVGVNDERTSFSPGLAPPITLNIQVPFEVPVELDFATRKFLLSPRSHD